jgi:type I restriction enzyme S subunit
LPPLPEQHRIVARVDQLMALCDQLEAKQQQRRQVALALPKALYTPLTTAEAPTERRTAWHRVRRSFDDLTILPEQIPALRQTILELAVRGRLVEQDPGDSPSCMAHDPSIEGRAGLPNPLPLQWKAARLGSLGNWFGGGTPSKRNDAYWNGEIPWVSPKDMKRLQIGDSIDHVTSQALEETSVKLIPKGSLLMVVRGMILAKNFPVAVTTGPVTLNQDMKALVPKIPGISDFLLLVLQAHRSLVMELVETSTHGTCRLGTARLQGVAIPIPPPAEQGRIVARVAFLMGLCNQVEGLARGRLQCQELLVRALASGR